MKKTHILIAILLVASTILIQPTIKVHASTVDLDDLMLSKWTDYLSWMTRYYAINGTTVDVRDYSQYLAGLDAVTQSVPIYLIAIMNMYDQTSDEYYLSLLKDYTTAIIANDRNYVDVDGIGEIFFASHYYYADEEHDSNLHQTAIMGIVCTKLYGWTGDSSYLTLADRIADESLNDLSAINNSTDLAWSWSYYSNRDETNAKVGVNRQLMMAWFYSLYGSQINSTFSAYVPKIAHWSWLAQISNEGLAYSIGDASANAWYSAISIYKILNAYLVDSSQFDATLKTKIANTVTYVNNKVSGPYDYQRLFFQTLGLVTAWKTDYFQDYISIPRTKAMLYASLNSFHLTDIGFVSGLEKLSFGFRWSQYTVAHLFMGYPLPDASFETSTMNPLTTWNYATAKHSLVGFAGGCFFDYIRDGADWYGVELDYGTSRGFYMAGDGGNFSPLPTSTITNDTYYVLVNASYGSPVNDDILLYTYPVGVSVGEVTGTNTPCLRLDNDNDWTLRVSNGTEYQINSWSSGSNYTLDTDILVWLNDTSLSNRRTFFIHAPTNDWNYTLSGQLRLKFTTEETNYRIVLVELASWGDLVPDASTAFSTLQSLASTFDATQPIAYDTMFDAYHDEVSSLKADADWCSTYEDSISDEAKLVGHNLPGQVSLDSWSYNNDEIVLGVSGSSGTEGSIKVYCGTKGKPKQVSGSPYNADMDYNQATKILALSTTHASIQKITVRWATWAGGTYPLTVSVLQNGMPTLASVVIEGENKTVFGVPVTFDLPYGDYFIIAYCGDKRQTKSIFMSGPQSVGFDFKVSEPPNLAVLGWTIPVFVAVVVGLYLFLFRGKS